MNFANDLLLIDFEGAKGPTQIGAILLDKNTLDEKSSFVSYIWKDMEGTIGQKSGITQEMLEGAPSKGEVGKMIFEKFGKDVIITSFVADMDFRHFRTIITEAGIDPAVYDYHVLDVWPLAYVSLLKKGYNGSIRSEEIFQTFGAKPRGNHNALEDCRITADVLRKVCFDK
jgi:DNA polymerase III epsilon subunit-like protein